MRQRCGLALSCVLLALAGCGGEPGGDSAPLAGSAPIASVIVADAVPAGSAGEIRALGLDTLALPLDVDARLETAAERKLAAEGPVAPAIPESSLALDRSSPRNLLDSALDAIALQDVAALARLSRNPAEQPQLTEDDAHDARRRFLTPSTSTYWQRIAQALAAGSYELREVGAEAHVIVHVGGAAGSYRIKLRKDGDAWYLIG